MWSPAGWLTPSSMACAQRWVTAVPCGTACHSTSRAGCCAGGATRAKGGARQRRVQSPLSLEHVALAAPVLPCQRQAQGITLSAALSLSLPLACPRPPAVRPRANPPGIALPCPLPAGLQRVQPAVPLLLRLPVPAQRGHPDQEQAQRRECGALPAQPGGWQGSGGGGGSPFRDSQAGQHAACAKEESLAHRGRQRAA